MTVNKTTGVCLLGLALHAAALCQSLIAPEPPRLPATAGRVFHIDSARGDDATDGQAPAPAAGGAGPWRTLARLARADLRPGDRVVLACGSVWRETLRLSASGQAAQPIVVAPPEGCRQPPQLVGSVDVGAAAWVRETGDVYSAPLVPVPLQLHGETSSWRVAHHPNIGHNAARPASPYLTLTGRGDTITRQGHLHSTSLVVGDDLKLPAGQTLAPGTGVRVRTNDYTLEERRISEHRAGKLLLTTATTYDAQEGWGYFLTGQAWMIDRPGEWHHDAATGRLRAQWPAGQVPTALQATVLPVGVDLQGRAHIVLAGLDIRHVGIGLDLRGSRSVRIAGVRVQDTADVGVAAGRSEALVVEDSQLLRTGRDALQGVDETGGIALNLTARRNLIQDSGVRMVAGVNTLLPVGSFAAIYGGPRAVIEDNRIARSGYIGIRFMRGSRIERNVVEDSCLVLNDCGVLHTWGETPNDSLVRQNIVLRARGNTDGAPPGRGSAAKGIYIDDRSTGVEVIGNVVTDTDHGVMVHVASRNTVQGNVLFGNRISQIWLQANTRNGHPQGDVVDNLVRGNQMAATVEGSVGLQLDTNWASTAHFGRFEDNRYLDLLQPLVARERTQAGWRAFPFEAWQQATQVGSSQPLDARGFSARAMAGSPVRIAGPNLIPNPQMKDGAAGWTHWNATPPAGRLVREACDIGPCLRYGPGGSAGVLISPNFSLVRGQWYRLSVDVKADQPGQSVGLTVRRGGGGNNGYEALTDRPLYFTAGTDWQRQAVVFQATQTVRVNDPRTRDLGARMDIEQLVPGRSVTLANPELVAITRLPADQLLTAALNASPQEQAAPCPWVGERSSACPQLHRLATGQPAGWPVRLPPFSAELFFVVRPDLADADRDGVVDDQDRCPITPGGAAVNAAGCALGQRGP